MTKAAFIRARIEPDLKAKAETVLHLLGITPTQAVTMLYENVAREQEWPIALKIPNASTRKALDETDKGIGLVDCGSVDDLFDKLGISDDA
jgi:DNA-damage-inducible protein J